MPLNPADRQLLQAAVQVEFSPPSPESETPTPTGTPLTGTALVKAVCHHIRVARSYWAAHNNRACRRERDRALALYHQLTPAQKAQIPQVLRVWLRYRSEKYFGSHRTLPRRSRS